MSKGAARSALPWSFRRFLKLNNLRRIKEVLGIYGFVEYPPPERAVFEVTNACNLSCLMCGYRHMTRKRGYMKLGFFKETIDQIKDYINYVQLFSTGEPLLHPSLLKMIDYVHASEIDFVSVSTNATLLNSERRHKFLADDFAPELLQLSVEGWSPETYEKYREGAKFYRVYENIKQLYELRNKLNKKKPRIVINLLLTKETNVDAFGRLWGKWCDKIHVSLMKSPRFFETPPELKGLLYDSPGIYSGCHQPFNQFTVSYDGKLGVCCGDFDFKLEMGNLHEESVITIWRKKEYRDLRKLLWSGRIEESICAGCQSVYYCSTKKQKEAQDKMDRIVTSYHATDSNT